MNLLSAGRGPLVLQNLKGVVRFRNIRLTAAVGPPAARPGPPAADAPSAVQQGTP